MKRLALAIVAVGLCASARAEAYPYFQLSSGTDTCAACHFAPAGGGLLTDWGRGESADTISRGGDGDFLHGLWSEPDWLAIGGDLRFAGVADDAGSTSGATTAVFPMQADLAARISAGDFSLNGIVGVIGSAHAAQVQAGMSTGASGVNSWLFSREHYVAWQPGPTGPYARAGRFYAPFGLRLPDHTTYVRRYTGYNLLEETYGLGAGWIGHHGEVHVTAFVSDPLQWAPRSEVGAAALAEWRHHGASYGLSVRATTSDATRRVLGSLTYKRWMEGPGLLWLLEVDGGVEQLREAGVSRPQLMAYAGPVWIPTQGLYTGVAYELYDEDLKVSGVARHAVSAWASFYPRAHFEIGLLGRAQVIGASDHAMTALLQVHYYL